MKVPLTAASNRFSFLLGVVAIIHSLIYYGSGTIPEAILALLLFLKAFTKHKQPWGVAITGMIALTITWIVNSGLIISEILKYVLSGLGIVAFAVIALSRLIFERNH